MKTQEVEVLLTEAKRDYTLLRYRLHATKTTGMLGAMLDVGGEKRRRCSILCIERCLSCCIFMSIRKASSSIYLYTYTPTKHKQNRPPHHNTHPGQGASSSSIYVYVYIPHKHKPTHPP
jgi:hypothetical protein